jgi:hypothetical protein
MKNRNSQTENEAPSPETDFTDGAYSQYPAAEPVPAKAQPVAEAVFDKNQCPVCKHKSTSAKVHSTERIPQSGTIHGQQYTRVIKTLIACEKCGQIFYRKQFFSDK